MNDWLEDFHCTPRYRVDGSVYYSARELCKWLGFKYWGKCRRAIRRSRNFLQVQGHDAEHIVSCKSLGLKDFELSRLGCCAVIRMLIEWKY
jgi:hypothetical protein